MTIQQQETFTIVSCKPERTAKNGYLELVLSDERHFVIHRDTAVRFSLYADTTVTDAMLKRVLHEDDVRRAYQRALYLLDRQAYSYQMLFQKLRQNYPEEICYEVMNRLSEQGFINDYRFAEQVLQRFAEGKHYGPKRLRQLLWQKGITPVVAAETVQPYEDPEVQLSHLHALLERKYGQLLEDPDDRRNIEKCKAALARMGYGYLYIAEAIRRWMQEATQ